MESIPKTPDVQVIVVDDNSTKGRELLAQVIADDVRCEFYVNDTGVQSAGACRNIGLGRAQGKWVLFSDADDYFLDGFIVYLEEHFDNSADIIFFAPTSLELSTGRQASRHILYAGLVGKYLKRRNEKNEYDLKFRFCVPWSKMYRRELVDRCGLEFETVPVSNDIMFCTNAALHAKSIDASGAAIYCVTKDSGTLTTTATARSERNFDVRVDVRLRRVRLLREHLSKRELRHAGLFCGDYLFLAFKWFGIKKFLETAKVFRKKKVKWFTFSRVNLAMAWQMLKG